MTESIRLRAIHLMDQLDAAAEAVLGPQCPTVSAAGVRCVLNLGHTELCDVRPWPVKDADGRPV
jgi:hypothetical protein